AFTVQGEGTSARPGLGDGSADERATVQGDPNSSSQPKPVPRKNVPVTVQQPARSSGADGDPTMKGKNAGGSGTRGSDRSDLPGKGEQGEGRSRISAGQVRFRSWSAPSPVRGRT